MCVGGSQISIKPRLVESGSIGIMLDTGNIITQYANKLTITHSYTVVSVL